VCLVPQYWGNLRKRDGTAYAYDCRRVILASLANTSNIKPLFKVRRSPFAAAFGMSVDRIVCVVRRRVRRSATRQETASTGGWDRASTSLM
jgi:hypothetical protein